MNYLNHEYQWGVSGAIPGVLDMNNPRRRLAKEGTILVPVAVPSIRREWFPSTSEVMRWQASAAYVSIIEGDIFDIRTHLCDLFCNLRAHL